MSKIPKAQEHPEVREPQIPEAPGPAKEPRAGEAIPETEATYRSLFEHMLEGAAYCRMLFDERGRPDDFVYLAVNDAFGRLTGLEDVIGKRVTQVIPRIKELQPELFEVYGRVASTGNPEKFEINLSQLGLYLSISVYSPAKDFFVAAFENITERKRAEEHMARDLDAMTRLHKLGALSASEDLEPVLTEIVDAAIAISGSDFGNIQLLDPKSSHLEIVAQRGFPEWWLDFWREVSEGEAVCGTALKQGERVIVEDVEESPIFAGKPSLEVMLRAGVRAVQSTPLVSRSGKALGMFSTHYRTPGRPDDRALRLLDLLSRQAADIIEQVQAEAALRASEEKFRTLADSMPQLVWTADDDGNVNYHNIRAGAYLTVETTAEGNWLWQKLIHPDDLHATLAAWRRAGMHGSYQCEHRVRMEDGSYRWHLSRARRDMAGGLWYGSSTDIHDIKLAAEAVGASERFNRSLISSSIDCIKTLDLEGNLLSMSDGGQKLLEIADINRYLNGCWIDFWNDEDRPRVREAVIAARHGGVGRFQAFCPSEKGNPRWWDVIVTPILGGDGKPERLLSVSREISQQKRAEEALRESELKYRRLFDNRLMGVAQGEALLDPNGQPVDYRFLEVNEVFERFTGLSREQTIGHTARELMPGIEHSAFDFIGVHGRVALTGEEATFEVYQEVLKRWYSVVVYSHKKGSFVSLFTDITQRKQAQEALRQSEQRLLIAKDAAALGIHDYDVRSGRIYWDKRIRALWGVGDDETVTYETFLSGLHPDDRAATEAAVREALDPNGGGKFRAQYRVVCRANGTERWIEATGQAFFEEGQAVRLVGTVMDITAQRRAEEALRNVNQELERRVAERTAELVRAGEKVTAERQRFLSMLDTLPVVIDIIRQDGRIEWANRAYRQALGDNVGRLCYQSQFGRSEPCEECEAFVPLKTGQPHHWEWTLPDGRTFDIHNFPFAAEDGSPAVLEMDIDITEQRRAQAALKDLNALLEERVHERTAELRASEARERDRATELQAILDAVPAAVFVAQDPECRNMIGSRLTYEMLRLSPGANVSKSAPAEQAPSTFRAMRDGREIPSEDLPAQRAAATGQPVRNYEFDLVYEDGTRRNMLGDAVPLFGEDGKPRGAVGAFVDITERKRSEESLRQTQKLESVGLLAGGIAHDFNNLLVGVIGNASLVEDMIPPDHPASDLVHGIMKTGEQLAHLTRQMLAYSGKGRFLLELLDLSAVIRDIGDLLRPSIPKKVTLYFDLGADLPRIEADRGQVQQVLMNLVINAAESIRSGDGLVTVATAAQTLDGGFLRAHPETAALEPGEYVVLEVRDTGCGMDETVKAKIFDPFFSTKFTGRGLGLAAVGGIMRGHKGAILVNSEPGKGSTFTVLFPASRRKAEGSQPATPKEAARGSGVVLVIDDEKVVRGMAKGALERKGYSVLVAYDGLSAIDILKRHPGKIDLAVLDLSMPGMSGEETLPELRKVRPEVKVLVSSGYSEAEAMTMFRGQKVSGFVQKPYTVATLAEKVKRALE